MREIIIPYRFRGPSLSANGGYITGLLAEQIDGPAEVTLKAPPPLEKPLHLVPTRDGFDLMDGTQPIASVRPEHYALAVPPCPPRHAVEQASSGYHGFTDSPVPHCFVCGRDRKPGDGLCIYTGPVEGEDMVAASFVPDASLAGDDGHVAERFVFAALDCPGAWAFYDRSKGQMLLGRIVGEVTGTVEVGERCTVIGWPIAEEGRKAYAGTAVFNSAGLVVASAYATWIKVTNLR